MVDEQGKVVGNHVESFTPVEDKKVAAVEVEDKKVAAVEVEDKKVAAVEVEVESEDDQVSFETTLSEYDEDGFKPWSHFSQMGIPLKIHKDNRVFLLDSPETEGFLGWFNSDTCEIQSECEESEDEFGSSDDEKDTELFD